MYNRVGVLRPDPTEKPWWAPVKSETEAPQAAKVGYGGFVPHIYSNNVHGATFAEVCCRPPRPRTQASVRPRARARARCAAGQRADTGHAALARQSQVLAADSGPSMAANPEEVRAQYKRVLEYLSRYGTR